MLKDSILLMLAACCLVVVGAVLGAWLTYRGRRDLSPLPTLPQRIQTVRQQSEKRPFTLPEVKA